jgi:hypothetical protein
MECVPGVLGSALEVTFVLPGPGRFHNAPRRHQCQLQDESQHREHRVIGDGGIL